MPKFVPRIEQKVRLTLTGEEWWVVLMGLNQTISDGTERLAEEVKLVRDKIMDGIPKDMLQKLLEAKG